MLLDTSGLLCLHDRNDQRHTDAVSFYRAAQNRLTNSYVIAELVALAHTRGLPRARVLTFVRDLLANPVIKVIWVNESLNSRALALLEARLGKTYSLCDAISFLLMRERNVREALTTDHHFEQEGFIRLLPP